MKSNKYLTIGLLTGFIVGGCIGVLAWAFLQNLFAISICAGTTIISEKYGVTIRTAQRWKESFESFVEDFLKKF